MVEEDELGEFGRVLQAWMQSHAYPPSMARMAKDFGVTRGMVSQWMRHSGTIKPDLLRRVSRVTGIPYQDVLDAMLRDTGHLPSSRPAASDSSGVRDGAPMKRAGGAG